MILTLNLAPSNDAALADLYAQINALKQADPLAPVHLLLPSARVTTRLRSELGDAVNVHFLQFYGLARAVLNAAHEDRIHEIGDTAARRLVHHLLAQMAEADELPTFGPVWNKPGFTDVMLGWLREMKSQGIHPEAVTADAQQSGNVRDRQLATLYESYQDFLIGAGLSDADGLLWMAAEALTRHPNCFSQAGTLFVYGFDHFNPVQMDLLDHLTSGFEQTTLYLLWDANRPPDSLALSRLDNTRQRLIKMLNPTVIRLGDATTPSCLVALRQRLFEQEQPTAQVGESGEIKMIEAPSREDEVRIALRHIKQLLLDGISPYDISLLAPKPGIYRRLVATVASEYGLPVAVEGVLGTNPAISALLNALSLSPDFPWRRTFDLLRSPYFDISAWLDDEQIDLLDRLTRERPVVTGEEQWQHALRPSVQSTALDDIDEGRRNRPLIATLPAEEVDLIRQGLFGLFTHLTPPDQTSPSDYVLWIQSAILGLMPEIDPDSEAGDVVDIGELTATPPCLHMVERCMQGPHAERDHAALVLLLHSLRRIVNAAELIPQAGSSVDWPTFRAELMNTLPAVPVHPQQDVAQVHFDALESGRGLTSRHLFILGLSEGEFPSPPPVDVLYAPRERDASNLPLRRIEPGVDASLWWQIVSNVGTKPGNQDGSADGSSPDGQDPQGRSPHWRRAKLVLLRPWLDDKGTPWPPSPYWQAVTEAFTDLKPKTIPVAAPMEPTAAAGMTELSTALAMVGAAQVPDELAPGWQLARRSAMLLGIRASWNPPGIYEGIIEADDLKRELTQRFSPDHVWSASRLNRYNTCPFGFFIEQILKLEPRPDPEEGLDVLQRGSLLHAILEALYLQLTVETICPTPSTADRVLALLDRCCTDAFRQAPQRYGFRPGPLWQQEQAEMRRLLERLLRAECADNGEKPRFQPSLQEFGFGIGGQHPATLLTDADGHSIRVRGVIDRIDRDSADGVRIIDYKSGSSAHSRPDIMAGRSVQTAVYALAAEQLLDNVTVEQSAYLHLPTRKSSGKIVGVKGEDRELLDTVIHVLNQTAENVRNGRFPNAPGKIGQNGACSTWCDLADICRVSRQSLYKGRKLLDD